MSSISRLLMYVRGSWRALPWETAMAAVAVVAANVLVSPGDSFGGHDRWFPLAVRGLLAAVLATPALFAVTLAFRAGRFGRRARNALSVAVVALSAASIVPLSQETLSADWFAWTFALALLAVVLVPFFGVALIVDRQRRFRAFASFVRRFAEATTVFALLWAAASGALAVVFVAIVNLFELELGLVGLRCGIVMTAAFVVSYLFELVPQPQDDRDTAMPELWRRLVTAIGAPFTAVMVALLAVYELWVLATGQMPKNLLSPLIIAAGVVGLFCALVVQSILHDHQARSTTGLAPSARRAWERVPSIRIVRALPVAILALLPMAAWAVYVRVDQHGFTPFRVTRTMTLACLAVLGVLGTVRWIRGRSPLSWQVPATAALFAAITAVGPLSARSLSIRSQTERLEALLDKHGVTARSIRSIRSTGDGPADSEVSVSREEYEQLESRMSALISYGALDSVFEGADAVCPDPWMSEACLERLGIRSAAYPDAGIRTAYQSGPFETKFGTLYRDVHVNAQEPRAYGDLRFVLEGPSLVARRSATEVARVEVPVDASGALLKEQVSLPGLGVLIVEHVSWKETHAGVELRRLSGLWLAEREPAR